MAGDPPTTPEPAPEGDEATATATDTSDGEEPASAPAPEGDGGADAGGDEGADSPAEEESPAEPEVLTAIQEGNLPATHRPARAEDQAEEEKPKAAKAKAKPKAKPKKALPKKLVAIKKPKSKAATMEAQHPGEAAGMQWYVVRVASGREGTVKKALEREIAKQDLSEQVPAVEVPTEEVMEVKRDGKKRKTQRKLYPGYVIVNMILNDDTHQLVRRTSGVGDVAPTPMSEREVEKMKMLIDRAKNPEGEQQEVQIDLVIGQKVKIKEGAFENFDGEVSEINPAKGTITVKVVIFNRLTEVSLEYWQAEPI